MAKVGEVLKFADRGISVEDARKAMLSAGEAPSGIAREKAKNASAGFVAEEELPPPPVAAAPVVAPDLEDMLPLDDELPAPVAPKPADNAASAPAVDPPKPKIERFENDQFLGEIRQENGKWVAELQYKNGAGTEKWTRATKNELMIALLEGKGNATLRVRAAKRRETLGVELDKSLSLPEDITAEEFGKMSEKEQNRTLSNITRQNILDFAQEHPEYIRSDRNTDNMTKFMTKNSLPYTVKNLSHAYEMLLEDNELDVHKPARTEAPTQPSLAAPATPKVVEDSAPAPAPASAPAAAAPPEPGVVVRKRGSSGLQPGQSSVPSGDSVRPEDGSKGKDLSEAELRRLSPIGAPVSKDLRARANAERIALAGSRV